MNKPKLKERAARVLDERAAKYSGSYKDTDKMNGMFILGVYWALDNLHHLLEPREQPLVNGKRVAIVEVKGE